MTSRRRPSSPTGAKARKTPFTADTSSQTASDTSQLARSALEAFVAADPKSLRLLEFIKSIAPARSTVLIQGENGVGKDLIASLVHYLGPSPEQPMVKIDCGSLPSGLLESELFGFERGAFTGAHQMKRGRLELAENGTLVLDEISAFSLAMQSKLLRVLEERRFDRLGGTKPIAVHARIVALSNIDLSLAVVRGAFREDLFYRLNVVPLLVPPLRERPLDVPALAARLLEQLAEIHRRPILRISPDAIKALQAYSFPGNVRELRNLLERVLISHALASVIELDDLPLHIRNTSDKARSKPSLAEMEREYIAEVLDHTRGKKSKAAQILGISRKNLLEKRKKYRL